MIVFIYTMRYKISLVLIFLGIFIVLLNPFTVFAADEFNNSSSSAQLVKVDHMANIRDRLVETITLFFKFNQKDKESYHLYLANKRLAELSYVIESGEGDLIEEASNRYSAYLGRLTNYIIENRLSEYKQQLLDTYTGHQNVLNRLVYKIDVDSGFWLLLQHNLNTTKILKEKVLHGSL